MGSEGEKKIQLAYRAFKELQRGDRFSDEIDFFFDVDSKKMYGYHAGALDSLLEKGVSVKERDNYLKSALRIRNPGFAERIGIFTPFSNSSDFLKHLSKLYSEDECRYKDEPDMHEHDMQAKIIWSCDEELMKRSGFAAFDLLGKTNGTYAEMMFAFENGLMDFYIMNNPPKKDPLISYVYDTAKDRIINIKKIQVNPEKVPNYYFELADRIIDCGLRQLEGFRQADIISLIRSIEMHPDFSKYITTNGEKLIVRTIDEQGNPVPWVISYLDYAANHLMYDKIVAKVANPLGANTYLRAMGVTMLKA